MVTVNPRSTHHLCVRPDGHAPWTARKIADWFCCSLHRVYPWWRTDALPGGSDYGQDVINALVHEISEGAMGRVGGDGDQNGVYSTMDLFRYNANGQLDLTDGRDNQTTYFSYDGGQTLSESAGLAFNNEYSGPIQTNGGDTADFTELDVFGTGEIGETFGLSQTDIEMMDVLGWTPSTSAPTSTAYTVSSGVTSTSVTLNNDDSLTVLSGGHAVSTTVSGGSFEYISRGGVASGTTVVADSFVHVFSGGTASGTSVGSAGFQFIDSGGSAVGATVGSGGYQSLTRKGVHDFRFVRCVA